MRWLGVERHISATLVIFFFFKNLALTCLFPPYAAQMSDVKGREMNHFPLDPLEITEVLLSYTDLVL